MAACCSVYGRAADDHFNTKKVAEELARFRTKGPGPTARLLLDGIAGSGMLGGVLLDVGSGIGALTFALLDRGMTRAVNVDASAAYVDASRQEAERRGRTSLIQSIHGDFVEVAPDLPAADIVTLDRVVCCYPSHDALLCEATRHANRCLALSYPRDLWYVRLMFLAENLQRRLARRSFRTFVHPPAVMEHLVTGAGFSLSSRRTTWMWTVDVYVRAGERNAQARHGDGRR